jgi:hypothetical protein
MSSQHTQCVNNLHEDWVGENDGGCAAGPLTPLQPRVSADNILERPF